MKRFLTIIITALLLCGADIAVGQDTARRHPIYPKKLYTPLPVLPRYRGGNDSLAAFIQKNTKYPAEARRRHISGIVQVEILITKEGKITKARVYKPLDRACDKEALRVVARMPDWIPAMLGREPIEMDYHVDIPFGKPTQTNK